MMRFIILAAITTAIVFSQTTNADDSVEFLNGARLEGKILEIRKDKNEFDFETKLGSQKLTRTYSYSQVQAVTYNGKRIELKPKAPGSMTGGASELNEPFSTPGESSLPESDSSDNANRSKQDILAVIAKAGATPPDWFESTPMNHPDSLDLSWPLKADGPWNESKNVGQYLWGRVNPNPSRWRSGIKLVHQCVSSHQGDFELLKRDMITLGQMYFSLLQDYPRAAYWLQKAEPSVAQSPGIHLAECYWRLGSKAMAMDMLKAPKLHYDAIKLLGEIGEIELALKVTSAFENTNNFNDANLNAGDALRRAKRLDEAVQYYQRVLTRNRARNEEYRKRYIARASGSIEAIKLYDKADVKSVSDGTYSDYSTGYNGDLHVQVMVSNGRIESVKVTKHEEKQFYAAISDTTRQILDKQSIQDIDGTSGATITSQAIIQATARAMAQGAK